MSYNEKLSLDELLVANKTQEGNCSACCFKDWNKACYKLICQDKEGHTVYWTLSQGGYKDIPFIWDDYMRKYRDIKSLCRSKISDLYKVK